MSKFNTVRVKTSRNTAILNKLKFSERRPLLLRRGPDASSPASQYRAHIKDLNTDLYNAEGELEATKMENAVLKEENIQLQAKVKRMEIGVAKVRGELLDLLY